MKHFNKTFNQQLSQSKAKSKATHYFSAKYKMIAQVIPKKKNHSQV